MLQLLLLLLLLVLTLEASADADVVQLSHVLLEIEVAAETLGADFAREWLLVVVGVHVEGEIVHLVKCLVTNGAFVGFVTAVGQFVVLVVALLVETLAAVLTDVRFVAGVDAGVGVECR